MEPANGYRICMTILSGERQGSLGLVYGGLAGRNLEPFGFTSPSYNWPNGRLNPRGIPKGSPVSRRGCKRLHIGRRCRCTMASVRPEPNLRKGTSYEGENCGGLHWRNWNKALAAFQRVPEPRLSPLRQRHCAQC